jgi:hypothetical protein
MQIWTRKSKSGSRNKFGNVGVDAVVVSKLTRKNEVERGHREDHGWCQLLRDGPKMRSQQRMQG